MNGPSSLLYLASYPPLVSIDGAPSNAITVLDTSRNLEQLIEVSRGKGYYLVSVPSVKDVAVVLEKM
jgi:hypothetical protein